MKDFPVDYFYYIVLESPSLNKNLQFFLKWFKFYNLGLLILHYIGDFDYGKIPLVNCEVCRIGIITHGLQSLMHDNSTYDYEIFDIYTTPWDLKKSYNYETEVYPVSNCE